MSHIHYTYSTPKVPPPAALSSTMDGVKQLYWRPVARMRDVRPVDHITSGGLDNVRAFLYRRR